jgi:CubicO group peptidase (beta-lactamase class C family)
MIEEYMKELNIPGVAVGVRHGDDLFTGGLGVTNVNHPLEVDDSTLFQIGSITKTFVGTLAMRLVEMGKLELDEPIRTYLPNFKVLDEEASEKATMRHLLTHTAGWVGDWFPEDLGHGDDAVTRYIETMTETPQLTLLGECLSYNNAGFNVAGSVIETVLGGVFSDIMQEMLFNPLEMDNTYLLPWDVMTHRFAVGHTVSEDGPAVAKPWSIGRASGPAGGIVTNVKDMMNYAEFQLGDGTFKGKRLLEPESLRRLHTPQVFYTPNHSVALTFWVDDHREVRVIRHGGGTVGQISRFTLVPDQDFGILLVTNAGPGGQLNLKTTDWALEHYLGVSTPEPTLLKTPQNQLEEYVGNYTATLTEAEVRIDEGKLTIARKFLGGFPTRDVPPPETDPPPLSHYGFYDEDHIIGLEAPFEGDIAQFIRDKDEGISWMRLGTRIHRIM